MQRKVLKSKDNVKAIDPMSGKVQYRMCAVDKNPKIDDVADFYRVFRERIFMAKKYYFLLYASSILDFLRGPGDVKSQEVGTPRFF